MLKLQYKDKMYEIKAQSIAFDRCHKIYLITDNNEADEAKSYGYELVPVGYLNVIWQLRLQLFTQCLTHVRHFGI